VDAVEAQRAIEIAGFGGQEKTKFAPTPDDLERLLGGSLPFDAVGRPAGATGTRVAHLYLERGQGRPDEIELADWADVLAKRGAFEERIDEYRQREVPDHHPGRCSRLLPEIEQLVREQDERQEQDSDPFASQTSWKNVIGGEEPARLVAREHHGAGCAEDVAGNEQAHDQKASPVNGGQDSRHVARSDLRSHQAVQDDRSGRYQKDKLERWAKVSPPKQSANDRQSQQIHA
jgi:hypothetical protein